MLGKLEKVEVRKQWLTEEYDFTPWLAQDENMQVLSDEINLDLTVLEIEKRIGSYKADIVAQDDQDRKVIIENQLEKTDHRHLGQIITYASGIEASVVIWISTSVTEEHRQAVDWLNENTHTELSFFAIQIELWQINDSPYAPKFHVISSPNDWFKVVRSTKSDLELSDTKKQHLDFWNGFKEFATEQETSLSLRTAKPRHWYSFAVGRSGFQVTLTNNTLNGRIGCELYIRGQQAKQSFAQLFVLKDEIETQLGNLDWMELPDGQDSRIVTYKSCDPNDRKTWDALYSWLLDKATQFTAVFAPLVRKIS